MKAKKVLGATGLVLLGILFGTILVSGFGWVRPGFADIRLGSSTPPVNLNADANSFSQAFIEVAEKVTPSIVQISVVSTSSEDPHKDLFFFPFKDFDIPREQMGSGSGIIISSDGYILTNNHVVEKATKVTVGFNDKRKLDAKVVGTDPLTDLAVIKVTADNLPAAFLGDSDKLKVGQWVMAIGNPMSLSSTVTAGIVSALNRGQLNLIRDSYGVENFIQTDAAINPGNSGGALVDLSGAVIGVNSAIATKTGTYIGYGFAIPINLAKAVAKDLIANGKVSRGYIGVQIREVDEALAKSLGLETPRGVIVEGIVEGGAAAAADVKRGDIILQVDERLVNRPNELQGYVAAKTAGTKVKLTIYRDGKEVERTVTLRARDDDKSLAKNDRKSDEKEEKGSTESANFDDIGLSVKNLSAKEKSEYKVDNGVMITNVKALSAAQSQGLGKDLIIIKADRKDVKSVKDLSEIIKKKMGSAVLLEFTDIKGNTRFVGLEIPN
ncbi:MAG TPA: Do family serine endopeptidase [Ignavibacteriaceae bacterium]|nr:Do family serine endopeptidase [Ignavibacteriaceae bacterium]